MKKVLFASLALLMLFSFAACAAVPAATTAPATTTIASTASPVPTPTATPTPSPTPSPTPTPKPAVKLSDIYAKMNTELKLDYISEISADMLKSLYIGLNMDDIKQSVFMMATFDLNSDEIVMIEVKDASKMAAVKKIVEQRQKDMLKLWETYLPEPYKLVQNAIIKTNGNYLVFIVTKEAKKAEAIFDSYMAK